MKNPTNQFALEHSDFVDRLRGRIAQQSTKADWERHGELALLGEALRRSETLVLQAAAEAMVDRRVRNLSK